MFRAHKRTVIAQEGRHRSLAVHLAQKEQRPEEAASKTASASARQVDAPLG